MNDKAATNDEQTNEENTGEAQAPEQAQDSPAPVEGTQTVDDSETKTEDAPADEQTK